jgi:hypothetical protein
MADIEKMREIFEEALRVIVEIAPSSSDFNALNKETDSLRARFNEAVMAKQNQNFFTINVSGSVTSEDQLKAMIEDAMKKRDNELRLGSVS